LELGRPEGIPAEHVHGAESSPSIRKCQRAGLALGHGPAIGVGIMSDGNCSFCGKRHDEVFRLIEGPSCKICSECVGRCANQIAAEFKAVADDLRFRGPEEDGGEQ